MPDDHWRRVSEKDPRRGTDCLVGWVGVKCIYKASRLSDGKFYDSQDGGNLNDPTHWQPLPAPPEEETP